MRVHGLVLLLVGLSVQFCVIGIAPLWVWGVPYELRQQSPGAAAEYFSQGILLLKKGDSKGAEAALRKSLKLIPNHVGALAGLAEALQQQGRHQEAREIIQQALVLQPKNGALHRAWGRYLLSQKEFTQAEDAFLKAIQLNAKDAAAYIDLGNLYLGGLKRPDQAAQSFGTAVTLAPKEANAHFGLGASYALLKRTKEAFTELDKTVRLAPNNPVAYLALGNLHKEQKSYDKALAAYTSALKIEPRFVDALMAKGDLQATQGNLDGAKLSYHSVIDLNSNHAYAYNNLAWIAAEQKTQLEDAVVWAKKAVSLAPSVPPFKDTLAWVYRARGDLRQAAETLTAALSATADDPMMTYHFGIVLAEQGKTSEAIETLKKATKLHLDPALAKDAEQRMSTLSSAQ